MSKNKFIGLIIMMVISLAGIIWVQTLWIRNALDIRNKNFNTAVLISLNNAANIIESDRRMSFFNDFMFNDSLVPDTSSGDVSSYLSIGSYSSKDGKNFKYSITNQSVTGSIDSTGRIIFNKPVIVHGDTTFNSASGIPEDSGSKNTGRLNVPGENKNNRANSRSVYINNQEFLDWIKKRASQFQDISDEMIAEVYQWEKTMQVNNSEVAFALQRSFQYSDIETPFEFAVIKDGKVESGTYKESVAGDFLKSKYKVQLFPDNIINKDMVLSVVFPERANYVLGSMVWILGGSLLFSLIILATFALSLYLLIRQKKISEMKSDFLNNMTHEFKTPIATISLAADTITNPKVINDESSIRHFVSMIKKENSRMNKKVETILQIASLDKKEIAFKFENVSMHSVIERAVDTIEIQVHQKNGRINLKL
ncbi:MAG: histidine kinase dimerization/phospho-acceptor domain-containing protein, partial [Bacteroidales bacterium]